MAREWGRVVQGATQGDVLVLRDLTKVGAECWGGRLPLAHPPFSWTCIPPRCTLGRGHRLSTACVWGSPLVR